MNLGHFLRMGQAENVGKIFKVFGMRGESVAANRLFVQF